ncbi:hypothetical protein CPC08DRAFT_741530 [Agrocybe pediades]|nr:hypothetical protein CPC08DRAFT_741530 [Agrocybe pediades]
MFYYISFLRPPPVQAAPYTPFSIKPQISNDLRTESFEGEQELYYSWSRPGQPISKPQKLTTWRPSSAYKDIPVPLPSGVRDGQYWRLILSGEAQAHGRASPESIDLSSSAIGSSMPFPVMSMPILFMGKGHKGALKQEAVERTYLVPVHHKDEEGEKSWQAVLRFVEKTSFDLDKKIWDSGIGLSSWLVELKENVSMRETNSHLQSLHDSLFSSKPRRILELGTGIGFVSAIISVLRPSSNSASTDESNTKSAIPLIQENFSLNKSHFLRTPPKAMILDWDDEELPQEVKELQELDAIIMADVTYNTASFPSLCRTLSRLAKLNPDLEAKHPEILLGYKQRDESERDFWGMAAKYGIEFEKIGERAGSGDVPVEIWSGRVVKS